MIDRRTVLSGLAATAAVGAAVPSLAAPPLNPFSASVRDRWLDTVRHNIRLLEPSLSADCYELQDKLNDYLGNGKRESVPNSLFVVKPLPEIFDGSSVSPLLSAMVIQPLHAFLPAYGDPSAEKLDKFYASILKSYQLLFQRLLTSGRVPVFFAPIIIGSEFFDWKEEVYWHTF